MPESTIKPEFLTDEMLEYLDDLRESGETNMFGAAPYLVDASFDGYFGGIELSLREAREVLKYWMATFSERQSAQ